MSNSATPLQQPTDAATEFQELQFFIRQRIARIQTTTLVKVMAVTPPASGLVGTVDVLPLVSQVDGAGNVIPHKTIYGRPYSRVQGGSNAIILDPAVNDIGVMVFASRDITSVIASGKQSPPSSGRSYNYADGLYLYSLARGVPTQYIQFAGGINVESPVVSASGNVAVGTGASGTFTTPTGQTVTVLAGIVVNID